MATITLEYDAHNAFASSLITTIKRSGVFKIGTSKTPNKRAAKATGLTAVERSMQEAREGKVNSYESVDALFEKLGI